MDPVSKNAHTVSRTCPVNGSATSSINNCLATGSPASARSGNKSSDATGRGACGHALTALKPDSASLAEAVALNRSGTSGPTTTGPGANWSTRDWAAAKGSCTPPRTAMTWSPWTPAKTSRRRLRALRRMSSTMVSGSALRASPTMTATSPRLCQANAAARERTSASTSPRKIASTTRASSRASHAPRASAACAYTCAEANAISRP